MHRRRGVHILGNIFGSESIPSWQPLNGTTVLQRHDNNMIEKALK